MSGGEWISVKEAADILGISDDTVRLVIKNPDHKHHAKLAGAWRRKPLSARGDFQVKRSRIEELAGNGGLAT